MGNLFLLRIHLVHTLIKALLFSISLGFVASASAAENIPSLDIISSSGVIVVVTANTGTLTESGVLDAGSGTKTETIEEKKDKEKTINDINTFLIESYKIKIDHILANLNISLERVTNNDPVAQAKLLEKIRNDISIKIQAINSRNISVNRKKILSSVFSYIQENLDAKISKLVQKK